LRRPWSGPFNGNLLGTNLGSAFPR